MSITEKHASTTARLPELTRLWAEPVFLLDARGRVLDANARARALTDKGATGKPLTRFVAPPRSLTALLACASGVSEPVLGALTFTTQDGEAERRRVFALALREDETRYVLRLAASNDSFPALTQRILELNREIAHRKSIQVRLEEALDQNQLLFRELQHRIKNHLQIVLGLISAAQRDAQEPGQRDLIRALHSKLSAVLAAQQLMYRSPADPSLSAKELIERVAYVFTSDPNVEVAIEADAAQLANDHAFPLALILNELFANAVKYGRSRDGRVRVDASLKATGGGLVLRVADHGCGAGPEPMKERQGSGFGLVKGLCRQLGAELRRESDNGCIVTIRFGEVS